MYVYGSESARYFHGALFSPPASCTAGCVHLQYAYLSKQKTSTTTVSTVFVCLPADNYDKCARCTAGAHC